MASLRLSLPSKSLSTPSISHLKVGRNRASVSLFHGIPIRSPVVNPLRIGSPMKEKKRDTVVRASASLSVSARTLQWVSAVSAGGEYGMWTAFLTLLIRLFYFIPGELDLPFLTMLFVITAPYQAISIRGTQGGAIIALAIAVYLAFQHFSRLGNLRKAFDQGSIVATLAIICITVVPFFFLF
ncbi:cold-regulated 413 inner membrane protein 2, chloroplastic-like isoform X2 [Carex rostrata]